MEKHYYEIGYRLNREQREKIKAKIKNKTGKETE